MRWREHPRLRTLFRGLLYLPSQRFAIKTVEWEELMARSGLRETANTFVRRLVKEVRATGTEQIPTEGPLLVATNERDDEPRKEVVRKAKGKKKGAKSGEDEDEVLVPEKMVSPERVSMGGPEGRVYWPEGMEEWLRPKKREVKKKVGVKDE